ncbi:MAG TPA: general stress protein [Planctomycetota bacterium]|nr:general stress protein [Planctomycetota bacterium]
MSSVNNSVVGIFETHTLADSAVKELQRSGLDIKKVSIIGRDVHTDEQVVGYYNTGDRMMYWGKQGAFWGGVWGLLVGAGFFWVPGVGPLLMAGPLVGMITGAVEGAAVVGGLSAVGAGLYSLGIPKDSVLQYETAIKTGKFVMIYHGTPEEAEKSRKILQRAKAVETKVYQQTAINA